MERTVLVTGATSGIGLATALHLPSLGFRVVGSARTDAKAEGLAKAAADAGVELETAVFDLAEPATYEEAVADLAPWGIVNNAGYMSGGALEDVPAEDARRQIEAMVIAPLRLVCLALPAMRERGEGRVVNISSIAAHTAIPLLGWYQASKGALSSLTDALRNEVSSSGVDVVLVEPGAFRTPIWARGVQDLEARAEHTVHPRAYERAVAIIERIRPWAGDPAKVAGTVGAVLTAGRPRPRYLVGLDTPLLGMLDLLAPRRVRHAVLQRVLAL